MNKIKLLTVFLVIVVAGCVVTEVKQLTPLEKQSLQTREYEESKEIVFPSVLSVLQDNGYIVKSADKDTGLITAESPTDNTTGFLEIFAGVIANQQTAVTAFIETIGPITKVRLNFVVQTSSSSEYGQSSKKSESILDAATYQNVFEQIESAIFIRSAN